MLQDTQEMSAAVGIPSTSTNQIANEVQFLILH